MKIVYIHFKGPQKKSICIQRAIRNRGATSVVTDFEFSNTAWKVLRNLSTKKTYMEEILCLLDFVITKVKAQALFLQ